MLLAESTDVKPWIQGANCIYRKKNSSVIGPMQLKPVLLESTVYIFLEEKLSGGKTGKLLREDLGFEPRSL